MMGPVPNADQLPSAQDTSYAWLKRRILQTPREEAAFLTEGQIAEAAGTSRTPVREALLRLESEGYLQRLPRKGVYVPPISDSEVRWLMHAREMVEIWCVDSVMKNSTDELVVRLKEVLGRQHDLRDDRLTFIDCDRVFHETIVEAAENPVVLSFYGTLRDRQLRTGLAALKSSSHRMDSVLEEHGAIVNGIASGDVVRAREAVAAHLARTFATMHAPQKG